MASVCTAAFAVSMLNPLEAGFGSGISPMLRSPVCGTGSSLRRRHGSPAAVLGGDHGDGNAKPRIKLGYGDANRSRPLTKPPFSIRDR
jgi:hypothetical protein